MSAKSRYWDHERCRWVTYETAVAPGDAPAVAPDALPEQRTDEETLPAEVG